MKHFLISAFAFGSLLGLTLAAQAAGLVSGPDGVILETVNHIKSMPQTGDLLVCGGPDCVWFASESFAASGFSKAELRSLLMEGGANRATRVVVTKERVNGDRITLFSVSTFIGL